MIEKMKIQHVSGVGTVWDVVDITRDNADVWCAQYGSTVCMLPKSEYRLCDPPEVWRDVSEECLISHVQIKGETWNSIFHRNGDNVLWPGNGYRIRKTEGGFRVEKKAN